MKIQSHFLQPEVNIDTDILLNMTRLTIDEYFMQIACAVAKRSTCLRKQVGAVIVKDKSILSTGYNGSPKDFQHCLDTGCIKNQNNIASGTMHELCRGVHAEQNAIIQAALHGVSTENASLYCTHQPCILCAKMLINAKVKRVVFGTSYPDNEALNYFEMAGVKIEQLYLSL